MFADADKRFAPFREDESDEYFDWNDAVLETLRILPEHLPFAVSLSLFPFPFDSVAFVVALAVPAVPSFARPAF